MKNYFLAICLFFSGSVVFAQAGHIMQGVGAVNMSMGGAATAQPLSIEGAIQWNPATLSHFNGQIISTKKNSDTEIIKFEQINIDLSILDKPGRLNKVEYKTIKSHTESGSRILATVPEYMALSKIVVSHHENYDGTGYPFGIKAELIPIESRIISIVDAYDAMVSYRSYRASFTKKEAIKNFGDAVL